jgi:hypothetical protein
MEHSPPTPTTVWLSGKRTTKCRRLAGRGSGFFEDLIVSPQLSLIVGIELILASTYLVTHHIKIFVDLQMS